MKTNDCTPSLDPASNLLDRLLDSRYALYFSVHPHERHSCAEEDLVDMDFEQCFVLVRGLLHKKIHTPQYYGSQDNKHLNDLLYRIGVIKRQRVPDADLMRLRRELVKVFKIFEDLMLMPLSLEVVCLTP